MKQILKASAITLASLGLAFSVFAQSPSPSVSPTTRPNREEVKNQIEELRENAKKEMEQAREAIKQRMEQEREDLKQKIETAREALKDHIEAKRAQLKQDLKKVKDERKKQTTERIDQKLDDINAKMTNNFVKALDQLDKVLVKIDERTDRAEASRSLDMSSVRTAIANAQTKINEARAVVALQAGKTYKITVTTEPGLKDAVKKAQEALRTDLKAVQEIVKIARDAVHDAARAFAKAHGRDLPSPSPSVSPSPSPTVSVSPTATP